MFYQSEILLQIQQKGEKSIHVKNVKRKQLTSGVQKYQENYDENYLCAHSAAE